MNDVDNTEEEALNLKETLEENIPELAEETGDYLIDRLEELSSTFHGLVTDIRGKGLLVGFEMNQDIAGAIVTKSLDDGLLINAVRPNMIRFMPPLNVTRDEIDESIKIIKKSINSIISWEVIVELIWIEVERS